MKKKKRIITIAGLLLVAIVGATFAYYTSNTSFENVFNAGKYKVTLTEVFESPDNWVPGETVPKTVTAKNDGTVPAAVRISYTEQWTKEIDGVETDITAQVSPNPAIINFANQTDWTSSNGYYYYKYILEPTDETSSFISGVTLDPNLDSVTCTGEGTTKTCEAQNPASGAKYKLTFTIQTIQYDVYKSEWNTNLEITEKPASAITYLTRQVEGQITPGDVIGIGETEDFYVISTNEEKTVLLAKYNLFVGFSESENTENHEIYHDMNPSTAGYGLQNINAYGYYGDRSSTVIFSSTKYWDDSSNWQGQNLLSPYDANGASYEGNPYPYVYNSTMKTAPDFSEECNGSNCYSATGFSIAYYVELYKTKLIEMGAPSTITGRLLSYEEVNTTQSIEDNGTSIIFNGKSYWLGSANSNESIWCVWIYDYEPLSRVNYNDLYYSAGVRPVIEIPTSELQ